MTDAEDVESQTVRNFLKLSDFVKNEDNPFESINYDHIVIADEKTNKNIVLTQKDSKFHEYLCAILCY